MSYRIFTDATADLTGELLAGLPEVEVLPMEIALGERGYTYGPGGDLTVEEFYAAQRAGQFASTSSGRRSTPHPSDRSSGPTPGPGCWR